jgi:hypothetical protein
MAREVLVTSWKWSRRDCKVFFVICCAFSKGLGSRLHLLFGKLPLGLSPGFLSLRYVSLVLMPLILLLLSFPSLGFFLRLPLLEFLPLIIPLDLNFGKHGGGIGLSIGLIDAGDGLTGIGSHSQNSAMLWGQK